MIPGRPIRTALQTETGAGTFMANILPIINSINA
jgi:hypothetical protein